MTEIAEFQRRVSALEASHYDTAQTLRWVVAKLGGIATMQDEHTLQLERIDSRLGTLESKSDKLNVRFDNVDSRLDKVDSRFDKVDSRLDGIEADVKGLRADLPTMIAETMREVLREPR